MPFRFRRLTPRAVAATGAILAASLTAPGVAPAAAPYRNPFSAARTVTVGRTDMGVDVCLTPGDPILALGDGIVAGIARRWFKGQPYLWYELTSGPDAGRYVYVAEQVVLLAQPGQTVAAGEVIGTYAGRGTCLETGWSTATGATLAQASTGYREGQVTPAGVSFARFLGSLGVSGSFELVPTPASTPRAAPRARRRVTTRVRRPAQVRVPPRPRRRHPPDVSGSGGSTISAPPVAGSNGTLNGTGGSSITGSGTPVLSGSGGSAV